jgi:S1-C subfamily serine protease
MKNKTSYGSKNTINLPLDLTKNFSIETIVSFQNGELNKGHGLICGFKDGDNYMYFLINANGQYSIGAKAEGINFSIKEWTHSKALNKQRNGLKLMKIGDKVYFLINGQVVHNSKFNGFKGNYMGYYALGKKEVLFENLIVKQDLSIKGASDDGKTASSSERKVNGSGFFIDHRGYIATNYHVVKDAIEIVVYVNHKGQQNVYEAEIVQNDMQNDLSILRINDNSFKPFTSIPYNFQTGHSAVGTSIFALGYPLANVMGHEIKFTDGKISAKSGLKGDVRVYQISVPIQSGNSGGALFDYNGNLIGVTSSSLNREYYDSENVNYAIKSSYLKNLIDVLPVTIRLPNDKTIATKQLTEKISILSDYVVLIHVE